MSPSRADPELDDTLIDAYDHDEALIGFENAFDAGQRESGPAPVGRPGPFAG